MFTFCISTRTRQWLVVITANLSLLSIGISIGWSSPILTKLSNINTTPLTRIVTADESTWMASAFLLTGLLGNMISLVSMECFGRKKMLLFSSFPRIANCMFLLFAKEVWHIILARAFDGLFMTIIIVTVSTYSAEIADKQLRGSLGSLLQIFMSIGVMAIMSSGPYLSYTTVHAVYFLITLVAFLPIWFLPESPYFLYSKGRVDESTKILQSLRNSDQEVCEEVTMFAESKKFERTNVCQLWKNKTFLKATGIACFLSVASQATGFNFVFMYFQTLMESTHTMQPEMASLIFAMVQLVSCMVPTFFLDKVGRKPVLIVTLFIIALGMIGVGTFFWCTENGVAEDTFLKYVPILAVTLINFGYTAGVGSILFIITPELFDGPERTIGVSLAMTAMSIAAFILAKYYYALLSCMGAPACYWTFSACSILAILFVIFCVPETKGKSFNEIQEELSSRGRKRERYILEKSVS